ncbi:universal stress protein [Halovivax sp.]|uniref:universal stress protein n=1 Tax=Halovivax sp. TaxID=1935978 RepID=UPI0025BE7492|nr:universal stress protein [Halovivax sp.]
MARRVLVPVDGSEHARRALRYAVIEFDDAEVVALHVLDPFEGDAAGGSAGWNREALERREAEAETVLAECEKLAAERDRSIETELAHGAPARAILGAVDDLEADHVVVGSRGRSGIGRVLLGSVAETVARRSPVSVTIVRPDRRD